MYKQHSTAVRTDQTRHDATDCRGNLEEVGDGLWVEQLVLGSELVQLMCSSGRRARCKIVSTHGDFALGDDHRGVLASHGDSGDSSSSDGLEGIL